MQREVRQLSEVGITQRIIRGRNVYFRANRESPVFNELKGLVIKTAGIGDVLRIALTPLANRIHVAFVYGSIARGDERQTSDLDIFVVGKITFAEVVAALRQAEENLGREVNPTVYPLEEFKSKVKSGHHFLHTILKGKKIFLVGDEHELERLA